MVEKISLTQPVSAADFAARDDDRVFVWCHWCQCHTPEDVGGGCEFCGAGSE